VFVSGEFNRAGGSSVVATNVAIWNEAYTSSQPWFAAANLGRGLNYQGYNACVEETDWMRPRAGVWSQAAVFNGSTYDVYFTGAFNKVNRDHLCPKDMPCGYYAPINIAKYGSSSGLGTLNSSALYDYSGGSTPLRGATEIAACSSGIYIAGAEGTIIDSLCGTFPSSATVAAGWRLNGTTWTAIGGTSSAGNIAPVYFQDVVTGGNAAFFITIDGYSGVSKYTP
jgi:hypothetical protein